LPRKNARGGFGIKIPNSMLVRSDKVIE